MANSPTSYTPTTWGALSEQDYMYCFQIAGVIWDNQVNNANATATVHDGFGVQLSLTNINNLQADLRSRLGAFDTIVVTELQNLIVAWYPLRLNTTQMDSGGIGDMSGLKYNPQEKRDQIAKIFAGMTGCMSMAAALLWKQKSMQGEAMAGNGVIGVQRG